MPFNLDKGALGEDGSMIINIMGHAALKMKKKNLHSHLPIFLYMLCV